ncbi:methyltransferase domain-containing protein [Nostoc sp. CENA67]|uniref:Methyltransferase domain-containing protein n=1 Tax=Amazonocrinis nigriterrae CENA67 TaxID=2794033 RepID=A0A8J7LBR7_9NOST|nr:methyltransferase domain-containing protein [Amazonocrinis nigriterrae]MBH8566035.1 methyltransferase domain-containing protein [Amazonocrinis nigriterrae CENA67]
MFIYRKIKTFSNRIINLQKSYISKQKLSYNDLRAFGEKFATSEKALIIYIEFPYEDLLPNVDVLPHYENDCERYYPLLAEIQDENYSTVIATGLLEHLKNPERLLKECYRILQPRGKVYISASSTFSVHRGPDDYFHVTQFGMNELISSQNWSEVDIRGSCGPFKTIGILLQRILLQCETRYFIRPFVEFLAYTIPLLDRFIINQYYDRSFSEKSWIDSMMPSNIQLIATK